MSADFFKTDHAYIITLTSFIKSTASKYLDLSKILFCF
jgi:hypothetical protein